MPYHTEIMLLEIFDLYNRITNEDSLNLELLERTFYSSQELINTKEELDINNSFEDVLDELLDKLPECFILNDDEIVFNEDLDIIYDQLLLEFQNDENKLTDLDNYLGDYLENIVIYKDLGLPIPLNDTKDIFSVNQNIVSLYKLLAKYELENKDYRGIILYIKLFREQLNKFFKEMDSTMQNKLKMCCAHFNGLYLLDEDDDFINSNWNIILFSKRQIKAINYAEIETNCFNGSYESKDEDYDEYNEFEIDEIIEDNTFEEIPYFLTNYLIHLNNFIINNKNILNNKIIEELLLNKYLLISLPELKHIEEYFLDNLTIDNLEKPSVKEEWLTDTSFELMLPKVMECALSLDYSDEDINNYPHLHSKIITNCLFIKTFLNSSINENNKKDIISQITNNRYYKHQDYKITTNIIDEIIFNNNFQLKL